MLVLQFYMNYKSVVHSKWLKLGGFFMSTVKFLEIIFGSLMGKAQ